MRDDLRGLRLRQAIVHRLVEVKRNLRHLARGDQGTDGDKAAIPWRESRTQPQIVEQNLGGVLHDPWNRRSDQLLDGSRALSLRCLVKGRSSSEARGS